MSMNLAYVQFKTFQEIFNLSHDFSIQETIKSGNKKLLQVISISSQENVSNSKNLDASMKPQK